MVPPFAFRFRNAQVMTLFWRNAPAAMQFLLPLQAVSDAACVLPSFARQRPSEVRRDLVERDLRRTGVIRGLVDKGGGRGKLTLRKASGCKLLFRLERSCHSRGAPPPRRARQICIESVMVKIPSSALPPIRTRAAMLYPARNKTIPPHP